MCGKKCTKNGMKHMVMKTKENGALAGPKGNAGRWCWTVVVI